MSLTITHRTILLAGFCVGFIPLISYWTLPQSVVHPHHAFIFGYACSTLPFLYVWKTSHRFGTQGQDFAVLLFVAFATRIVLLTVPPVLSEDLWRYIWDGSLHWFGQNPYHYAPIDSRLDSIAQNADLAQVRQAVGHPHVPTIYPPFAQASFALATIIGPSQVALRLLVILSDVSIVAILWLWTQRAQLSPRPAVLYAFLPLSVIESAVGGHVDSIGVAMLLFGLFLWNANKPMLSTLAIWCAAGVKLVPAVMVAFFCKLRARQGWRIILLFIALTSASLILYQTYPHGLVTFAQKWRGNDGIFALLSWAFETYGIGLMDGLTSLPSVEQLVRMVVGADANTSPSLSSGQMAFAYTKLCAVGMLATIGIYGLMTCDRVERFWLLIMSSLLLLSPMVHPWYILWVMPFVFLLEDSKVYIRFAFTFWALSMWITYWPRPHYLETGIWTPIDWVPYVIYIPIIVALLGALYRGEFMTHPKRAANKNS